MKKILFLLLLTLLLLSCSKKVENIGVWSEEGAVIYSNKDEGGKIVIEKELMAALVVDGEVVGDMFQNIEMYRLSPSEWRQRNIVVSSLLSVTGDESIEKAYENNNKLLRKSQWSDSMVPISSGFDERLLVYVKENGGDYNIYKGENAISGISIEGNEEKIRVFLKKWIKAIVG